MSASREEGYLFLVRLEHEYLSGKVRFDAPGETLLGVLDNSTLVAIGGLTQDLNFDVQCTGRVRHVYVLPEYRRRGIGKLRLAEIEPRARAHFNALILRTTSMAAVTFYERIGYEALAPEGTATHRRLLNAKQSQPSDLGASIRKK
jgi:GNAT superfamily N-acetyltransferase